MKRQVKQSWGNWFNVVLLGSILGSLVAVVTYDFMFVAPAISKINFLVARQTIQADRANLIEFDIKNIREAVINHAVGFNEMSKQLYELTNKVERLDGSLKARTQRLNTRVK